MPALILDDVVDPPGAGDSFAGGFMRSLVLAARRAGITRVILPKPNEKDLGIPSYSIHYTKFYDAAQVGDGRRSSRRARAVHLQLGDAPELQECRAHSARRTVNQHALARSGPGGSMHHLVGRDVIQHEADGLGGVQAVRYRNQLPLRQADELGVRRNNFV